MNISNPAHNMEFDTDVYFTIVADSLIANFGNRAMGYADRAMLQMRNIGDDEGYNLWKGVHDQLRQRIRDLHVPKGITIH